MARTAGTYINVKCVALILVFTAATGLRAQSPATEYEVKAAYLLNFGKFIKWPAAVGLAEKEKFSICVLGEDPFGQVLDGTVRDEKIAGKPVSARRLSRAQDSTGCQVLFISGSEEKQVRKLLPALNKAGVLTVSDVPGFLDHGGMIQFTFVGNRVRFEINLDSVESGGLTLSSELLKVASLVKGKGQGGRP
jgi:hypothetical protein